MAETSWVASSHSPTQEYPDSPWNPEIQCHVHKKPSQVPIPSLTNPVRTTPSISLSSILILSSHLLLGLLSGLFSLGFPTKILYAFRFDLVPATYPAHIIHFPLLRSFQGICPRPYVIFRKRLFAYGEELLAPRRKFFSKNILFCSYLDHYFEVRNKKQVDLHVKCPLFSVRNLCNIFYGNSVFGPRIGIWGETET